MRTPLIAFAVFLCIAPQSRAQRIADSARVVVTRREALIFYPRDTTAHWGWSAGDCCRGYSWHLSANAIDRTHSLDFHVEREQDSARVFPSLAAVVAAGQLVRCDNMGMVVYCFTPVVGEGRLEGGRVVVLLRDSVLIADLFGLRPPRVWLGATGPERWHSWGDSARVEYVAPEVPVPTDSVRAAVAEQRRLADKNNHRVIRTIRVAPSLSRDDSIFVALGDTINVSVHEEHCSIDTCTFYDRGEPKGDSLWIVGDTTVLAMVRERGLRPRGAVKGRLAEVRVVVHNSSERFVARRRGVTTVHIGGIRAYTDTASVASVPATSLTATVVVVPRAAPGDPASRRAARRDPLRTPATPYAP